jgi:predicted transcriptional regulator
MRTTINLDDDLYAEIKVAAARSRRTVTSFIDEALRRELREQAERKDGTGEKFVIEPIRGGRLLPGVDLDDSSALLDLMDGIT